MYTRWIELIAAGGGGGGGAGPVIESGDVAY